MKIIKLTSDNSGTDKGLSVYVNIQDIVQISSYPDGSSSLRLRFDKYRLYVKESAETIIELLKSPFTI